MEKKVSTPKLSQHAVLRMAQRNLSLGDLEYVLEYGERIHKTGATIYILRKRDIRQSDLRKSEITRLEGTVVLTGFTPEGNLEIITMYRNRSAHRALRCKTKHHNRRKYRPNRNLPRRG